MEINFIRKTTLALSLLATASFAHAGMNNNLIPCPSITSIQETASKIDASELSNGYYVVYTSTPAFYESQLPWYVAVPTTLSSSEEALKKGQETVQRIETKSIQDAYEDGNGHFICLYQPGYVVAVGGDINQVASLMRR